MSKKYLKPLIKRNDNQQRTAKIIETVAKSRNRPLPITVPVDHHLIPSVHNTLNRKVTLGEKINSYSLVQFHCDNEVCVSAVPTIWLQDEDNQQVILWPKSKTTVRAYISKLAGTVCIL